MGNLFSAASDVAQQSKYASQAVLSPDKRENSHHQLGCWRKEGATMEETMLWLHEDRPAVYVWINQRWVQLSYRLACQFKAKSRRPLPLLAQQRVCACAWEQFS